MIDDIMTELSHVLDIYQKNVGYGFFTRRSRHELVKNLRDAIEKHQAEEMIKHVLDFAMTMQGNNADVGFWSQSRLNNLLWGNRDGVRRGGGIYQKIYVFLLTDTDGQNIHKNLQTHHPQYQAGIEKLIGYNWACNHSLRRI